jgi:benzoyl-CoA reductase subunit C
LIDRSVNTWHIRSRLGGDYIQMQEQDYFRGLLPQCSADAIAARSRTGQKIVGYLGAGVPVELILAAGLIPVRVGAFEPSTRAVDSYLEIGDSEIVAVLADALQSGGYDFLDYLIIGNSPTFNVTLFHFLREMRRGNPAMTRPILYFHEIHHGDSAAIRDYNVESCRRLAQRLGSAGLPPTVQSLQAAIEQTNACRQAIDQLGHLRRQHPPRLSGTQALMYMARWQTSISALPVHPENARDLGPRVVFSGSDVGHFQHYALIEAAGCTIVADDHDWGEWALSAPTRLQSEPMHALAARYEQWPPRAGRWPRLRRIQAVVELAVTSQAQGLVYWPSAEDQASAWDFPRLAAELARHGIAALDLGPQPAIKFDGPGITAKTRQWLNSITTHEQASA